MRNLILNSDLKRLFQGAAAVTACGLVLGAFMHPTLKGPDDLGGPQMLMGTSGPRGVDSPGLGAAWTSYQGQIPDYVIGTDATKPPPELRADPIMVVDMPDEAETGDRVEAVQTAWQEPPREPTHYPSMSGNVPNESDLPPAPEPPGAEGEPAAG